jgi:hypothetical protein
MGNPVFCFLLSYTRETAKATLSSWPLGLAVLYSLSCAKQASCNLPNPHVMSRPLQLCSGYLHWRHEGPVCASKHLWERT